MAVKKIQLTEAADAAVKLYPLTSLDNLIASSTEDAGASNYIAVSGRISPNYLPYASTVARGAVQLITNVSGSAADETTAVTPKGVAQYVSTTLANSALAATFTSESVLNVISSTVADEVALQTALPQATTASLGGVMLATVDEALAGTNTSKTITPFCLHSAIEIAQSAAAPAVINTTDIISDSPTYDIGAVPTAHAVSAYIAGKSYVTLDDVQASFRLSLPLASLNSAGVVQLQSVLIAGETEETKAATPKGVVDYVASQGYATMADVTSGGFCTETMARGFAISAATNAAAVSAIQLSAYLVQGGSTFEYPREAGDGYKLLQVLSAGGVQHVPIQWDDSKITIDAGSAVTAPQDWMLLTLGI